MVAESQSESQSAQAGHGETKGLTLTPRFRVKPRFEVRGDKSQQFRDPPTEVKP